MVRVSWVQTATVTKTIRDIENTVLRQHQGVPLRIRDVAQVQLGPDFRRGALDYNGGRSSWRRG